MRSQIVDLQAIVRMNTPIIIILFIDVNTWLSYNYVCWFFAQHEFMVHNI